MLPMVGGKDGLYFWNSLKTPRDLRGKRLKKSSGGKRGGVRVRLSLTVPGDTCLFEKEIWGCEGKINTLGKERGAMRRRKRVGARFLEYSPPPAAVF